MTVTLLYIVAGYLTGSILFARLAAGCFGKPELFDASTDGNPGAANAFRYGGFWCGAMTLLGDLGKSFVPVFLYCRWSGGLELGPLCLASVLAAPVVGHAFPIWHHFQGGKGIAATFGSLLGLLMLWRPVVLFALVFVFFSCVLRIDPHFYRTVVTYLVTLILFVLYCPTGVWMGFSLMSGIVLLRLHLSKEHRSRMAVKLLWMR